MGSIDETDTKYPPSRLLPPIDASYQPPNALSKIPAASSLEDILAVLERDGGVILTDFASSATMESIDRDLEPYQKPVATKDGYDNFIGRQTLVIPGLVSKSDAIANILDTNETLEKLLKSILEDRYPAVFETHTEEMVSQPLLSAAAALNVGHGSPRQALHRDDMIFSPSKPRPDIKINEVDGFSCFLAGTKITRENGGTMVIPGSHKWEQDRRGRPDEVTFLEMERGDAFIFLSTLVHGAGYNSTHEVRKIFNLIFIRGTLRQEENQFLCNPRSKVLKMSPKLLSLLGFKKPPLNWLGMVENDDPANDLGAIYEKLLA